MTLSSRLYEITRQSLKALVIEYEREGRSADAMHAMKALQEVEKVEWRFRGVTEQ